MEIKYIEKGEAGKTCADCRHFQESDTEKGKGTCFGHEVSSEGSCNMFTSAG